MNRLIPIVVVALIVGLSGSVEQRALNVSQTPEGMPALSQADAEANVRGRLGGQRAGFEAILGSPGVELSGSGTLYDVAGYGLVMVSYLVPQPTPEPTDIAVVIILRSERPENLPADQPDPSDWTMDVAEERARAFLPVDVEMSDPAPSEHGGRVTVACRSEALATVFAGAEDAGHCQVTYLVTSAGNISFATLALGSASGVADAPDACAGMVTWSQLAAANMAAAQDLVGRLADLSEDDPGMLPALRELARAFARLAVAQQLAPVPQAAAEANAAMVATFQQYAAALSQAASALETHDRGAFEAAIALVEQASATYVEADALILDALATCHLVEQAR